MAPHGRKRLYIEGVPQDVGDAELEAEFAVCGPVSSLWISQEPFGFAYVEFDTEEQALNTFRYFQKNPARLGKERVEVQISFRPVPSPRHSRSGSSPSRVSKSRQSSMESDSDSPERELPSRRDRSRSRSSSPKRLMTTLPSPKDQEFRGRSRRWVQSPRGLEEEEKFPLLNEHHLHRRRDRDGDEDLGPAPSHSRSNSPVRRARDEERRRGRTRSRSRSND